MYNELKKYENDMKEDHIYTYVNVLLYINAMVKRLLWIPQTEYGKLQLRCTNGESFKAISWF